jgi:glycosyltransferase involved in cell wall biosynthesis
MICRSTTNDPTVTLPRPQATGALTVCHVTTVHPALDSRIYLRECVSLAEAGFAVHLVAPSSSPKTTASAPHPGIQLHSVRRFESRLLRMLLGPWQALQIARRTGAQLWHLHDPELLPLAALLPRPPRVRIVYDAHENLPQDISTKTWIPALLRHQVACAADRIEKFLAGRLDAVVAATETIADRLRAASAMVCVIRNYPRACQAEVIPPAARFAVYAGLLSRRRGLFQMIEACQLEGMPLRLVGHFSDHVTEAAARSHPGWSNVEYLGRIAPDGVRAQLLSASAGLCLLAPDSAHDDALPTKVFEYMQVGIPVIASRLQRTREVIDRHGCGLCVDYTDMEALRAALARLRDDAAYRQRLGAAGRDAMLTNYRWEDEARRLCMRYAQLGLTPAKR